VRIARRHHGRTLLVLAVGALMAGRARATRAAEAELAAPGKPRLGLEWVGLELAPVSVATSSPPADGRPDQSFSALQAGPGGNIRLLRLRWEYAYVIPIVAGLYVSGGTDTIFAHAQTEGGVIVPGTERRLELGVGLGVGVLAISYARGCDGSCVIGGQGLMASLAARYLFWSRPTVTVGINMRVMLPLAVPEGEGLGYYTGYSGLVMSALEVGFGRQ
jgi:hypothetical protein